MENTNFIIRDEEQILITGATGFIGTRLIKSLLDRGFRNLRCFARSSNAVAKVQAVTRCYPGVRTEVITGNLLSREDCNEATRDAAIIYHLATGGGKSFPDAFLNSVVTTRNLLEASVQHKRLKRFVNVSSFTVYTNARKRHRRLLDESCPVETHPEVRGDAYCYAKVKQDEIVTEYCLRFGIPYVILRPGSVYGPGRDGVPGRVGIDTFGVFLHLGGSNSIPFTYVDNCADAIALAGLQKGIDGEVFNIVDDNLPSSRQFLRLYKRNVRNFMSIYVPKAVSYTLCYLWERYSAWSEGQLPPAFNRRRWNAFWRKTHYSNDKLKTQLGWTPKVSIAEGFANYFQDCRERGRNA